MPQQPAKPGMRVLEALGLTVFLGTAVFLTAILVTWVAKGPDSFQKIALAVSTACAVVGVLAMLVDAVDLWLRGRRMLPATVKVVRYVVFGAVLAAVVASIFGKNSVLVMYLLPSMIVYLFIARRPSPTRATSARRGGSPGPPRTGSSGARASSATSTGKARQRRGGKKHR